MNAHTSTPLTRMPGFVMGVADQVSSALWRNKVDPVVTQPQFLALAELHHAPGISQYELADSVGIDRVTIGPVLKRFEEQGWVERRRDTRDARKAVLTLLPAGLETLRRAIPRADQVTDEFMLPLTHTEQAVVVQSWAALGHVPQWSGRRIAASMLADVREPAFYPWFFLRIARRRYKRLWRETASEDVTPPQFALMSFVEADPGIDIRTAAELAHVEESTAVRIIMRTVRLRLIRDSRDPEDARRSLLRLTDLGRAEYRSIAARLTALQHTFCENISPRFMSEFLRLTRLVARLTPE